MAAEGGAIITFIFIGENSEDIPRDVTHLIIHESITVIPAFLFHDHPNLVEVNCHSGVTKIEEEAFAYCSYLRRVIIPGVTIVEECTFSGCGKLVNVECDKLERIGGEAFILCETLGSINLTNAKIVEGGVFSSCHAMTEAIFGKDLESIEGGSFVNCTSLESITVPLRSGLFTEDGIFAGCANLKRVDLTEVEFLRDFADALLWESWRSDFHEVIELINEVLPNADPGDGYESYDDVNDELYNNNGGKAIAIREWIESVLRKVTYYKTVHRELLNEAAAVLQLSLSSDAVMNNILPFIELPQHAFDREDDDLE